MGGCLPLLVQMPVWIALYRALLNLSTEGLLNEGFFWIPSLAGPVSGQEFGGGFIPPWLLSAFQGTPELGWWPTAMYLVLPILLVVSQMYMQQMMTPPTTDPQQAQMQQMMKFMPIMFGYFALVVPAGLTLYWFTSNILAMAQQYFTRTQLNIDQKDDKKKSAVISTPVPESAPVPAAASSSNTPAPNGSGESASGESTRARRKSKNAKRRKKKRR